MNRFLKTFALLNVSLFVLASGVDIALDHISRCPAQSSYTFYSDRDAVMIAYTGDLKSCPVYIRPGSVAALTFEHRT